MPKPFEADLEEGTITISMDWYKWLAIILVLGSGSGLSYLGFASAKVTQDAMTKSEVIALAEATAEELANGDLHNKMQADIKELLRRTE